MPEKPNYPQIPSTVWWGLRTSLRKSPNATVDTAFLSINLGVQPAAARQYLTELKRIGVLNEEGRATPLAMRWRNDETYRDAADEILRTSYPQSLLDVAPPGEADRDKVVSWFMHNGLGEGTARNKCGTYLLIANEQPHDAAEGRPPSSIRANEGERKSARKPAAKAGNGDVSKQSSPRVEAFPLNVNVQIHISADASVEQIQAIFAAMKSYLSNDAVA